MSVENYVFLKKKDIALNFSRLIVGIVKSLQVSPNLFWKLQTLGPIFLETFFSRHSKAGEFSKQNLQQLIVIFPLFQCDRNDEIY